MALSFILSTVIGYVYRYTHRNVSYSQSYVQTLVIVGMVVALIMLVVGSNLARAFSLVGALSVIRFRNAIKETRDVGFVFLAMAIGMACGARFYTLAAVGAVVICVVVVLMHKFDWFALDVQRQVVKVQVPAGEDHTPQIRDVLIKHTSEFELVSTETIRGGALNEVFYTVRLKKGAEPGALVSALQARTSGQRVTVLTGYDSTDL
ncbi:membrane protein [Streptomyces sp. 604F]|nr:membrane protein [Streptomyces sp. 604F]